MSIQGETSEIIKQRFHTAQLQALSSVGHWHDFGEELCTLSSRDVEECMGHDPLDLLEQELYGALAQVVIVRAHQHMNHYNENGICGMCGWDGNA